jgi:hypothetical protein
VLLEAQQHTTLRHTALWSNLVIRMQQGNIDVCANGSVPACSLENCSATSAAALATAVLMMSAASTVQGNQAKWMDGRAHQGQSRAAQVNNSVVCNEHYHMLAASRRCRMVMLHSCAKFTSTQCTQTVCAAWCGACCLGGQSFVAGKTTNPAAAKAPNWFST